MQKTTKTGKIFKDTVYQS